MFNFLVKWMDCNEVEIYRKDFYGFFKLEFILI